jgi:hypothetical protein
MFLSLGPFPAEILPFLVGFVCLLFLIVRFFVALIKRKEQRAVLSMAGLAILFFAFPFAIKPAKAFHAGFRARIRSTIAPEELRRIAVAIQDILFDGGRLPGPQKNPWSEQDHRARWQVLVKSTQIEKLDPWMEIEKSPDYVALTWGGALVGHWGVVVDTGTEQHDGDIAKGIRTYLTPN